MTIPADRKNLRQDVAFLNVPKHGPGFMKGESHPQMVQNLVVTGPRYFSMQKLNAID